MNNTISPWGAAEGGVANDNNSNSNVGVGEISDFQFGETLDALLDFDGLSESSPPSAGDSAVTSVDPMSCNPAYKNNTNLNTTTTLLGAKPIAALSLPRSMQQQQPILPNPEGSQETSRLLNQFMMQPMQATTPQLASQNQQIQASEQFAMPAPPGLAAASRQTSSIDASARICSTASKQMKNRSRKRPVQEISEDEGDLGKRREDRNMREQKRSQQITDQIERLRQVLSDANVPFKTDKYSTLTAVVQYVKQLQSRSTILDSEHRKLLDTIVKASDIVNNQYVQTNCTENPVLSTDLQAAVIRTSSPPTQDDRMVLVNGIDYKSIFKSCPFACSIASIDGRFIDCNKEFEELTAYPREELLRGDVATTDSENCKRAASSDKPADDSVSSVSSGSPSCLRNMSLFNVLKRSDMERVFVALSDMLKRGSVTGSQAESDTWIGSVEFCRAEKQVRTRNTALLQLRSPPVLNLKFLAALCSEWSEFDEGSLLRTTCETRRISDTGRWIKNYSFVSEDTRNHVDRHDLF